MKKFLMPLFLLASLSVGFTSCSDDDDDNNDTPVIALAKISLTANGEESPKEITLKRGTVYQKEGKVGVDDQLTLNLKATDGSKIKKVQITINNSYEYNATAVDANDNVYNDKFTYETPSTEKKITLVGVYGKYTIKVTTDKGTIWSQNLEVVNEKGNSPYSGSGSSSNRYLSNKQTFILDASGKQYAKKFSTNALTALTYNVSNEGGVKDFTFGTAKLHAITEEDYENYQGSKGDFYLQAEGLGDYGKPSISKEKTEYLVYKAGSYYYLIHILEMDGDIIKFDIQY